MQISDKIYYVGVNDRELDLFEGQYAVPNGMAYNSYVIADDKIAVMDTVDARFGEEWLSNLGKTLGSKQPDYLIIHHMEPDHSANVALFLERYKGAKIVASAKAFGMLEQFYSLDCRENGVVVSEGDTLELGEHTLRFFTAPMVHWPEVIVSYDEKSRTVFSADAFGKFGALDADEDWACEARRYYFGIVGKYGAQAAALLKKLSSLEINAICPLHGPVLKKNLDYYLGLYKTWTAYESESDGVLIAYTSVYGNTKKAALRLGEMLEEKGVKVAVQDLARCDMAEAVEDAFRYSKLVLATTTYNSDIFPFMREFIGELVERGFRNKKIALIENGTWAPTAAKVMAKKLSELKGITLCENTVTIKSALKESDEEKLARLCEELAE